jgi:hypothetical protein
MKINQGNSIFSRFEVTNEVTDFAAIAGIVIAIVFAFAF